MEDLRGRNVCVCSLLSSPLGPETGWLEATACAFSGEWRPLVIREVLSRAMGLGRNDVPSGDSLMLIHMSHEYQDHLMCHTRSILQVGSLPQGLVTVLKYNHELANGIAMNTRMNAASLVGPGSRAMGH